MGEYRKPKDIQLGEKTLEEILKLHNEFLDTGDKRKRAKLNSTDLSSADLRDVNLCEADLSDTKLSGTDLERANLCEADLSDTKLNGADLERANLEDANLEGAELERANLEEVDFRNANLRNTDLRNANLRNADLRYASLRDANLRDANLEGADLERANLKGANLKGAILILANLTFTNLECANFQNVTLEETNFSFTNLSKIKNLEACEHTGPSSIDIHTIIKSKNLPLSFLMGCGLPDKLIDYLPSLLDELPIQFYSCFISYNSKDEEFAKRIHADLQDKGIRCWFAPEDMKIGDKIRKRIDESIRFYDKLLLVLSKNSVNSSWVEYEAEKALAKEMENKSNVLFPISLDKGFSEIKKDWAESIVQTRNIGDFSDWKNHDSYKKSFDRLIRDLKQES